MRKNKPNKNYSIILNLLYYGQKISGRVFDGIRIYDDIDLDNEIKKQAIEKIAIIDTTRTKEKIEIELSNVVIREFEHIRPKFKQLGGFSTHTTGIYLNKNFDSLKIVVHELIHELQGNLPFSLRGLVEGATESYTLKATGWENQSQIISEQPLIRSNLRVTSYKEAVLIVRQMETILGNDLIKRFALRGDLTAIKQFKKEYGKELFSQIRKFTFKSIHSNKNLNKKMQDLNEIQNRILVTCFDKKYKDIRTLEDAINYLKELKELEESRIHIYGDKFFENYYKNKFQQLLQIYQADELKNMKYTEMKFKPFMTEKEKLDSIKKNILQLSENNNYEFENLQQYEYKKDGTIFEVITSKGIPVRYIFLSDNMRQESGYLRKQPEEPSKYFDRLTTTVTKNKNGEITLSKKSKFKREDESCVQNVVLEEVSLAVTKEEWDERVEENKKNLEEQVEQEKTELGRLLKRIKFIFRKKENLMLPEPILKQEEHIEERKSWKLTEEQRKNLNFKVDSVSKGLGEVNREISED